MASRETDQSRDLPQARSAVAVGSLVGALAASSCCMLPLALFTLGASGPWIGRLVRLAPYQPYFIAATIACLGCGYWLVYRSSHQCTEACGSRAANKLAMRALVLATVLVIAAIGFNVFVPLLNS